MQHTLFVHFYAVNARGLKREIPSREVLERTSTRRIFLFPSKTEFRPEKFTYIWHLSELEQSWQA